MYSITVRRMIAALVLKYWNGECLVIGIGYAPHRPRPSDVPLTTSHKG
jgi:hypothetical protein